MGVAPGIGVGRGPTRSLRAVVLRFSPCGLKLIVIQSENSMTNTKAHAAEGFVFVCALVLASLLGGEAAHPLYKGLFLKRFTNALTARVWEKLVELYKGSSTMAGVI